MKWPEAIGGYAATENFQIRATDAMQRGVVQ